MRWIVRGDIDGFFGLALDNLVQLLLIDALCRGVLGFPPELVYGRILPGAAISILVGNVSYARQAKRAGGARPAAPTSARCPTASTPSRSSPTCSWSCCRRSARERRPARADPARVAWQAGLSRRSRSGLIELAGALVAERVRKATPRAALLSTLAGIALSFISLGFLFRTFARPLVGLTTLAIVMLTYFGRVRFKGRHSRRGGRRGARHAARLDHRHRAGRARGRQRAALHLPVPVLGDLLGGARAADTSLPYLSVIVPMGLFNVLGSLQNIESAEAAGDAYDTRRSLTVNGFGSIAAALFGSAFPDHDLHRPPGLEGARRARRLLDPQRRVRHRRSASPARSRGSPGRSRSTPAWRSCCGSAW